MTRSKTELLVGLAAVVLGTIGYLFHCAPAEFLGLLIACVAFGMALFRALPPDEASSP
jgi:hypothetical protein